MIVDGGCLFYTAHVLHKLYRKLFVHVYNLVFDQTKPFHSFDQCRIELNWADGEEGLSKQAVDISLANLLPALLFTLDNWIREKDVMLGKVRALVKQKQ